MFTNPYGVLKHEAHTSTNLQTYIPVTERHKLATFAPNKGDTSIILNHLIRNLILDLNELTAGTFTAIDYHTILTIVLQRRPLTGAQHDALRSTTCCPNIPTPTGVHNPGGSPSVRSNPPSSTKVPADTQRDASHRESGTHKTSTRRAKKTSQG